MLLFVPFLLFSRFVDPALSFDLIHFSAAGARADSTSIDFQTKFEGE